ncbi:MAG TPA: GNAT family N-acetyltransferase [Steroidobacteraceae bacterium]|nr:GNAT family N-acetyltransferase [Steroidobacteraceae bacterium]
MSNHALIIRNASLADLDELVVFARNAFRDTYRGLDDPQDIEDYCLNELTPNYFSEHINASAAKVLLAISENELVGYAIVTQSPTPECVKTPAAIELARLYLRVDKKGLGLGASLMRAVQNEARRFHAQSIWLSVYDRNTRAVEFYRKWGFVDVGAKPFRFGGRIYFDPVMCAPLQDGT